jgi:glycosyltransferase involved in cell wall biosynthesis
MATSISANSNVVNTDLVSVVVPTFNRAYCIEKTIKSVLSQTYHHVELIIIDDGSTDGTRELILGNYGNDPRVRYVFQPNDGVSSARNHGIRLARGEFIALLDSDDEWEPWKLELQVAVMNSLPDVGMVWTDMAAVDSNGRLISPAYLRIMYGAYKWFPETEDLFKNSLGIASVAPQFASKFPDQYVYFGDIYSPMLMGNLVHTSTVLLRRNRLKQVGGFREDFRYAGEDYDFHLRTCREGPVAFINTSSIIYQCGREDQITEKYGIHFASGFLTTVKPFLKTDRARIILPQKMIDDMLASAHRWFGEELMASGKNLGALRHFMTSIYYRPFQPKTLGFVALSLFPSSLSKLSRQLYCILKAWFMMNM